MGLYIDPPNQSKESWLKTHSEQQFSKAPSSLEEGGGFTLVCLVFNTVFTAAAVVYNENELSTFKDPNDYRRKVWFWVLPEKVLEVCPNYKRYL